MARTTRPKPPTKAEQIEALQAEIEDLKQRLADAYRRATAAEEDVKNSDPYKALQRQNEELLEIIKMQKKGSVQKNKNITEHAPKNPKRGRPAKITEDQRQQIRNLRKSGASIRTIAAAVNVSVGTAAAILKDDTTGDT